MNKKTINEKEYIDLVNSKMMEHKLYKEGMKVEGNPRSSDRPLGLSMVGGLDVPGIVAWAQDKVQEEYELVVTSHHGHSNT